MKKFGLSSENVFFIIIKFFVRLLPVRFNHLIARSCADIFFVFSRRIKRNVKYNLKQIYFSRGENIDDPVTKVRRVFRNFARYIVDLVYLSVLPSGKIDRFLSSIEGEENLKSAFKDDRGVIIVTLHIGNWELGGALLSQKGYNAIVIFEKHPDERVTKFFNYLRQKHGIDIIDRRNTKAIVNALRNKKAIILLSDLAFDSQKVFVDFLGVKYGMPAGPVILAMKYNVPVITGVCIQAEDGYSIIAEPLLEMEKTGNLKHDMEINAQRLAGRLENLVKRFPEQWFVFEKISQKSKVKSQN